MKHASLPPQRRRRSATRRQYPMFRSCRTPPALPGDAWRGLVMVSHVPSVLPSSTRMSRCRCRPRRRPRTSARTERARLASSLRHGAMTESSTPFIPEPPRHVADRPRAAWSLSSRVARRQLRSHPSGTCRRSSPSGRLSARVEESATRSIAAVRSLTDTALPLAMLTVTPWLGRGQSDEPVDAVVDVDVVERLQAVAVHDRPLVVAGSGRSCGRSPTGSRLRRVDGARRRRRGGQPTQRTRACAPRSEGDARPRAWRRRRPSWAWVGLSRTSPPARASRMRTATTRRRSSRRPRLPAASNSRAVAATLTASVRSAVTPGVLCFSAAR